MGIAKWLEQICGHCAETVSILHHNVMVMFCSTDGTVASVFIWFFSHPCCVSDVFETSWFLSSKPKNQQWIHGPQIEFPHKKHPSWPARKTKLMGRCQAPEWTGHLCSPNEGANLSHKQVIFHKANVTNKWLFQISTYSWPASRFCWGVFYLMGPKGMDRIPELHANGRLRSSHLREGDKRNQHRNGTPVPQDQAMRRALWMNSLLMPVSTAWKSSPKQTNMENTKVISGSACQTGSYNQTIKQDISCMFMDPINFITIRKSICTIGPLEVTGMNRWRICSLEGPLSFTKKAFLGPNLVNVCVSYLTWTPLQRKRELCHKRLPNSVVSTHLWNLSMKQKHVFIFVHFQPLPRNPKNSQRQ